MADDKAARRKIHWTKTRNLTYLILVLWAAFGILVPWFAKELNSMSFLGFKLGYYFVVQGSLIAFVVMIIVHNIAQDKIDAEYGSDGK
ncbi:MAG: DUF4212 domain-containing protein [Quisquiliibacterium sp.]